MNTIYGKLGGASAVDTTDRELLTMALKALEEIADTVFSPYDNKLGDVILALRERLAQPVQDIS